MMSEINDNIREKAVIDNVMSAFSATIKLSPYQGAEIKKLQESLVCYSGSESPFFNAIYSDPTSLKDPHQHFSEVTQFFSRTNSSFIWWWMQQTPVPQNIQTELDNFGFQFLGQTVGITKDLADINADFLPDKVSIREVMTENDYQVYVDIFSKMYLLTESAKLDFKAMFNSYGPTSKFKHYLACYEEKPAAIISTYIHENTVGVYNGATLPDTQKKGLCAALYRHAMVEGKRLGCTIAIAQNTTPCESKSITDKLGFTPCCVLLPFIKVFKRPGIAMLFKD